MLQCNRYPGLDANEIIRLTSAIGQEETFIHGKCFLSERLFSELKPDTPQLSILASKMV